MRASSATQSKIIVIFNNTFLHLVLLVVVFEVTRQCLESRISEVNGRVLSFNLFVRFFKWENVHVIIVWITNSIAIETSDRHNNYPVWHVWYALLCYYSR